MMPITNELRKQYLLDAAKVFLNRGSQVMVLKPKSIDPVSEVKHLLVPIFEAEKKYGLKSRHFRKFRKSVDHFYCKNSNSPGQILA